MVEPPNIQRYIGLDITKAYFSAVLVDAEKQTVFGSFTEISSDRVIFEIRSEIIIAAN